MFIRSHFLSPDDEGGSGSTTSAEFITVQVDGADVKVPVTALEPIIQKRVEKEYVPVKAHNDQMARLRKQVDGLKDRRSTDELMQDPEFKAKAIQAWGLDPNATNAELRSQIERHKLEMTEREIKPRDVKLQKAGDTITKLRQKDLRGQILQAAAGVKVEEKYLRAPAKGAKPLIVSMFEDNFGFDDENGEWFAKGQNGQAFTFSTTGDVPYQTVAEFFQAWANSDGKEFLRSEQQKGADATTKTTPVAGQVGNEIRLTEEQIRNIPFFKKMQKKAEQEGLTIVRVSS